MRPWFDIILGILVALVVALNTPVHAIDTDWANDYGSGQSGDDAQFEDNTAAVDPATGDTYGGGSFRGERRPLQGTKRDYKNRRKGPSPIYYRQALRYPSELSVCQAFRIAAIFWVRDFLIIPTRQKCKTYELTIDASVKTNQNGVEQWATYMDSIRAEFKTLAWANGTLYAAGEARDLKTVVILFVPLRVLF